MRSQPVPATRARSTLAITTLRSVHVHRAEVTLTNSALRAATCPWGGAVPRISPPAGGSPADHLARHGDVHRHWRLGDGRGAVTFERTPRPSCFGGQLSVAVLCTTGSSGSRRPGSPECAGDHGDPAQHRHVAVVVGRWCRRGQGLRHGSARIGPVRVQPYTRVEPSSMVASGPARRAPRGCSARSNPSRGTSRRADRSARSRWSAAPGCTAGTVPVLCGLPLVGRDHHLLGVGQDAVLRQLGHPRGAGRPGAGRGSSRPSRCPSGPGLGPQEFLGGLRHRHPRRGVA